MKNFRITVNGNAYDVAVEELGGAVTTAPAAVAPVAAAPVAAPAAAPAASNAAVSGEKVVSPMPGKIVDIKVSEGASVNKGDVLVILEAMKMENEIVAPAAGKIETIKVSKGSSVESGDLLLSITV